MYASDDGLLVIGSGPAGSNAATAYRKAGGTGPVRLLSADHEPPYARPPLSKEFLRAEAGEQDLPLEDPDFYRDRDIELHLADGVAALDTANREVRTDRGRRWRYGSCVLALGAGPVRPPVDGADHPGVLVLRSASDGRTLRRTAGQDGEAVVVGAGFIGCEASVSLARRGMRVTLVFPDAWPQAPRLGEAAGRLLAGWLTGEGVRLLPETRLTGIDNGTRVLLDGHRPLDADLVLLATGMRPDSALASAAGLATAQGRVCTDQHLRTSAPGVYAAGDVALAHNSRAGRRLAVEHWGEALTMGEIAGRNAAGSNLSWDNAPGFWSVIGDRVIKYTAWGDGFDETELVRHPDGGVTVWYGHRGTVAGVLTHNADEDYERGTTLVEAHAPMTGTGGPGRAGRS